MPVSVENHFLTDAYGRRIRDLRISLTDRCNFRCFYCLPNGEPPLARKDTILTFDEITLLSGIFVSLGIEKIRLTGGEPLLRKNLPELVEKLAALKSAGLRDLAMTTNGYEFPQHAEALKQAGLDRVTISIDSLQKENFERITGVDALDEAVAAVKSAKELGLSPVRVNAVIVRGFNDNEIGDLARFAREQAVSMRFIEFMPLDSGHEWRREFVVPGREIKQKVETAFPLVLRAGERGSETAQNYLFADGAPGEIGIIAPVTEPFCGACSRIRLTADGQIRTCLFSTAEHDLRDVVRKASGRDEISDFIRNVVLKKEPRHFINDPGFKLASRSMSFIGG
jgi:cyclic pyranopterin phosphate synthase